MSEPTSVINTNEKNASFTTSPSGILLGTKSHLTAAISDCPVTDPGSTIKVRFFLYYFFFVLFILFCLSTKIEVLLSS